MIVDETEVKKEIRSEFQITVEKIKEEKNEKKQDTMLRELFKTIKEYCEEKKTAVVKLLLTYDKPTEDEIETMAIDLDEKTPNIQDVKYEFAVERKLRLSTWAFTSLMDYIKGIFHKDSLAILEVLEALTKELCGKSYETHKRPSMFIESLNETIEKLKKTRKRDHEN